MTAMRIGMIGLGRMGGNMAQRLREQGIEVVGYDRAPEAGRDVSSLQELCEALPSPRIVWSMVPAGEATHDTIDQLAGLLEPGDLVIDGGNSPYTDDPAHAAVLERKGVHFLDCGVSGGVWGLGEGYALMVGGGAEDVAMAQPLFDALKPAGEGGFVYAGPTGAGHFAKMVHNGIEYGMMQAFGEGYALLEKADLIPDPDKVVASWRQGSVIRSWLLDLFVRALHDDPGLTKIAGQADDSGEGRWMVEAATDLGVPIPATAIALFARMDSRDAAKPAMRVVSALRNQFGGHAITAVD
jgi:6-phosphogluconate dehydrogenase